MFILGMDLLSQHLEYQLRQDSIKGLKLAQSAQPITNSIYMDDILLIREVTLAEVDVMLETLNWFSGVSGQIIGPQKSKIWFSAATKKMSKDIISQILGVTLNL